MRTILKSGVISPRSEELVCQGLREQLQIKTPNLKSQVKNLSGGNQQKVVIAKWLLTKARVFIFDEPTRGIDVGAKDEIHKLMIELVKQGASIIMISSEIPEVLKMSDRVLVLRQGQVEAVLDNRNLTKRTSSTTHSVLTDSKNLCSQKEN